MDFALSDNQKNIIATFREFGESVFTPESVFQWRKDQGLPDEVVKGFVDRYFALDDQSPDGMGIMSQTLILEELCRCAGAALPFQNDLFNLQIMGGFADETVSSRVLDDYRQTGRLMFSLGVSEPNAGSDAASARTKAIIDGDDYVINGSKCFISNMGEDEGDYVILIALTDPAKKTKGMSAIIVDRGTKGFSIGKVEDKMGLRAAPVSELIFDDCRVPKTQLLGKEGRGFMIAMAGLDGGRIGMASQGVGVAEGALEAAVEYSKQRVQFGKPINANQGLQWYLADMATRTEAAKMLTLNAADRRQHGENIGKLAAMAKYYASENAVYVAHKSLQIHGGYGYMKDYAIERMYRDARIIPLYEGTSEVQKMVISRAVIDGK